MFKKLKKAAEGVIEVEPFRFATPGSSFDARLLSTEILTVQHELSPAITDASSDKGLLSEAPAEGEANLRFPPP
jgi:hypothetical protein